MTQTVRECKPEVPKAGFMGKAFMTDKEKSDYNTYVMGDWGKSTGMKPIGIKPRFIHEEHRMDTIVEAIDRATKEYYPIRQEWIDEYNELAERRRKK